MRQVMMKGSTRASKIAQRIRSGAVQGRPIPSVFQSYGRRRQASEPTRVQGVWSRMTSAGRALCRTSQRRMPTPARGGRHHARTMRQSARTGQQSLTRSPGRRGLALGAGRRGSAVGAGLPGLARGAGRPGLACSAVRPG